MQSKSFSISLEKISRASLGFWPTPLQPLPNLSRHLGGPTIYIKRDDCTGLGAGGNKVRKLEFLLGDALSQGTDVIITTGALQSNHARQTAAAAAKLGLKCCLVLQRNVALDTADYQHSGNILLDDLFGAERIVIDNDIDASDEIDQVVKRFREAGKKPYVIPRGGTNLIGDLGYVACAFELIQQTHEMSFKPTHIIQATGSGGTQAGLVAGLCLANSDIEMLGISIKSPAVQLGELINACAEQVVEWLAPHQNLSADRVNIEDRYIGPGYGLVDEPTIAAIKLTAQLEGILLDPVYTGKAMAGLIALINEGRFTQKDNVIFLHTGGLPGLFAYREFLSL